MQISSPLRLIPDQTTIHLPSCHSTHLQVQRAPQVEATTRPVTTATDGTTLQVRKVRSLAAAATCRGTAPLARREGSRHIPIQASDGSARIFSALHLHKYHKHTAWAIDQQSTFDGNTESMVTQDRCSRDLDEAVAVAHLDLSNRSIATKSCQRERSQAQCQQEMGAGKQERNCEGLIAASMVRAYHLLRPTPGYGCVCPCRRPSSVSTWIPRNRPICKAPNLCTQSIWLYRKVVSVRDLR
jgi:hypothetical protein